jgi:hypothetical protein
MVNHPNRNWRKRWQVDLVQSTATHQPSGLIVRFFTDSEGKLNGKVTAGLPSISTDLTTAQQQANQLARLLREANEIYIDHLHHLR